MKSMHEIGFIKVIYDEVFNGKTKYINQNNHDYSFWKTPI